MLTQKLARPAAPSELAAPGTRPRPQAPGTTPPTATASENATAERPPDALDGILARAVLARTETAAEKWRRQQAEKKAPPAAVPAAFQLPGRNPIERSALFAAATTAALSTTLVALAKLGATGAGKLTVPEVIRLAGLPRALPDLLEIGGAKLGLRAGITVSDLADLATDAALSAGEVVALAGVDWPIPELKLLGTAAPPAGRSRTDLAKIAAGGNLRPRGSLTIAAVQAIAALPAARSIADLQRLAAAPLPSGRTAADVQTLASLGGARPLLTFAEATTLAQLDKPMDYLGRLASERPNLMTGRTVADMVTLAQSGLETAVVTTLLCGGGVAATMRTADIVPLVRVVPGIETTKVVQLANWLHPSLSIHRACALCTTLIGDGLTGDEVHALVGAFAAARVDGAGIDSRIDALRTEYKVGQPVDITTLEGTRVLTGPMLKLQLDRVLAGGAAAVPGLMKSMRLYPDGTDPATRAVKELWADANSGGDIEAVAPRTRQRLALNALMTRTTPDPYLPRRVQLLFEHKEGRIPRKILPPSDEDTHSEGHIVARHVLDGTPEIKNEADLALRVHGLAGLGGPCGVAGAFNTAADAQKGIQDALDKMLTATATDWDWMRDLLARGESVPVCTQLAINAPGVKMRLKRNAVAGPPPATAASRCKRIGNPPDVTIRILGRDCPGAFAIHSAWPT